MKFGILKILATFVLIISRAEAISPFKLVVQYLIYIK